ncbi:hypothetical protein [uncultured Rubinisphaera sp.]|uniref:hypothetical protein n=1 Tax=uncultured Rubinisphaera sp. TaxID=1678686 RepID=UPI0030DAEA1E
MSHEQEAVEIIDRATGDSVSGILHKELNDLEIVDVEVAWSPVRLQALRTMLQKGVSRNDIPQHVHWNWAVKAMNHSGILAYRSFGVEAAGKMQGLMLVRLAGIDARLDPDKGRPIVYIDFIETAPWNAKEFTDSPVYKGVGVRLIQAAAQSSIDEGFSGRVGLHSLSQAKPFYTHACEMQLLGADPNYHNLDYYELTAVKAAQLLKK